MTDAEVEAKFRTLVEGAVWPSHDGRYSREMLEF